MNYYDELLASIDDAFNKRSATYWEGSVFEPLMILTNDERGRWGEDTLHRWLTIAGISNTWDGDSNINPSDGIYDIKVDGYRVEVKPTYRTEIKTSTLNSGDGWQHDGIYSRPLWDKLVFFDVDYDHIYLTVMSYEDFAYCLVPEALRHKELGKGAHLYKNQTERYKFDFSATTLKNAIKHGHTEVIPVNEIDPEAITSFLRSKFS